jgi:hypothetical protein
MIMPNKVQGKLSVRLEVFTAVTMKIIVFCDVIPCASCKNERFGVTFRLDPHGDKNRQTKKNFSINWQPNHAVILLLVTANAVLMSQILATLMMEAIRYPETSVLTRATRHQIPEDDILRKIIPLLY